MGLISSTNSLNGFLLFGTCTERRWYASTCVIPGVTDRGHSISICTISINQKENIATGETSPAITPLNSGKKSAI